MPWRSASVSLAKATSNRSFKPTMRAIAYGDDGSMRIWPSQSTVMKRNVGMRGRRAARTVERHPRHAAEAVGEERVRALLDPPGDVRVGGTTVRRVVLE